MVTNTKNSYRQAVVKHTRGQKLSMHVDMLQCIKDILVIGNMYICVYRHKSTKIQGKVEGGASNRICNHQRETGMKGRRGQQQVHIG